MEQRTATTADLVPFVPRLTLEWLRKSPDLRWLEIEGTVAFVDISGFTSMSERLSSRGRAGAEEVTDVMNTVFSALLDAAYAEGGGLLKFGGDALLLLYEGARHAERAARATFEMRSELRRIGRPRTSAGAVQLAMHAGLHSGAFHFFLVGESHRELLVTGPAATVTVEMEATSEAGEIVVSASAAELLPADTLGATKGVGYLLKDAPPGRGALEPLPDIGDVALEAAVPAPLREQLLDVGPLEGEHRAAAIAFVRFSGVDDVIRTEGAAAAAGALEALVCTVQRAADEHGVTFLESDVDRDGGRIVLVSGAPQTFGDDEERLLRAVRAAVDAGLPLPVHVGVSRGRVFAGQVGAEFRRTYTVLGDTAALAARLMARAGEDEIYVAADALTRGGARFATTELDPFAVKGKAEPVRAFVLGELLSDVSAPEDHGGELPFVDRERERAVLSAAVAPVQMGFGTLVELVGEPGIGKSRLAEELRRQCTEMRSVSVRCEQYESTTPYHAFRPLLRSLVGVDLSDNPVANRSALADRLGGVDGDLVVWAPLLSAPLGAEVETTPEVDDLDPSFRRARLHGVLGSLLGRLLDSPTLLVFEDVHWMDDASCDLLRHLGTQLPTRPWLACTTRRTAPGGFEAAAGTPPLPALTLRLEALPADDAKQLVRAAAGGRPISEDELAAIAERGDGNPLFLQELAIPDGRTDELPETVEALVAARIDRLAPADRALLRWASVLGASFSGSLIADVLERQDSAVDADAWDRLAEFVERDPYVAGGFRFRHALIRDAAYEGLSYRRRRELHARIAEVLELRDGDSAAELLSLHFSRAGRWAEAWRYSIVAGRNAQEKWANAEAAEFYRRSLDAARAGAPVSDAELGESWERLGDCLRLTGELDEAARAFSAARSRASGDVLATIGLLRKEGALRDDMGRYSDAIRWYNRALKAAASLDETSEAVQLTMELELFVAQTRFRQGAFGDCIRRCEEIVRAALPEQRIEVLAPAYLLLHLVHALTASPERVAYRGLALPLYEELGDLRGQASSLNNLGIEAYYEGDWPKAVDLYERSRALHERIGDVTHVGMTTNNIGELLSDQGHYEEARALFEDVIRSCDQMGQRLFAAVARANVGRVATRAGDHDGAEEILRDALEHLDEIGAASFVLEAELRLAELDACRGDRPHSVLQRVDSVLSRSEQEGDSAPLRAAAERARAAALAQLGERDAAREALDRSLAAAAAGGASYERALSLDLLAALGGDPEAAAESATLFARLGVERVARPPV